MHRAEALPDSGGGPPEGFVAEHGAWRGPFGTPAEVPAAAAWVDDDVDAAMIDRLTLGQ